MTELTQYESRFRALVEELQTCDGLEILHSGANAVRDYLGDAEGTFAMLERDERVKLGSSLERCFHRLGDFSVHWRAREPQKAAGEFRLSNLYEAIVLGAPTLAPIGGSSDTPELLESFRTIDEQPRGGTGTLTAIRLEPDMTTPEVWFYHVTRGSVKLDVDYCGYLDALLATKGFYYWQYLFADVRFTDRDYANTAKQMRLMLDVLPRLFPIGNYGMLGERLKQRMTRRRAK